MFGKEILTITPVEIKLAQDTEKQAAKYEVLERKGQFIRNWRNRRAGLV